MTIDRLSATSHLIAALRAEISSRSERSERSSTAATGKRHENVQGSDAEALRCELAAILSGVDETDTVAVNAIRPRVVRTVLLWEFGSELREHPQWQPMLDRIVETLASSPEHQAELVKMMRELRRTPRF